MTMAEWLACSDPEAMVGFLGGRASERKLRLFAAACCRRIVRVSGDESLLQAVETSERYADGLPSKDEVLEAWDSSDNAVWAFNGVISEQIALAAVERATKRLAVEECARCCQEALAALEQEKSWLPWERRTEPWWTEMRSRVEGTLDQERKYQADLLRCIVGDPLAPRAIEPVWLTPDVVSVARTIDADREYERMPKLTEALERAACTDAEILNHCRGPGPHAKGCWVVDSILGKS